MDDFVEKIKKEGAEDSKFLAVWFTPQAIRDHYVGDDSPAAEWVREASEETLISIGLTCLDYDQVWETFHYVIDDAVTEEMS